MSIEQKTFWTIEELCAYTGYTRSYIYKLTHNNTLPYYKMLGKLMFSREDIFRIIQEGLVKSNDQLEKEVA
jgi:excisionase family DNA binding protein